MHSSTGGDAGGAGVTLAEHMAELISAAGGVRALSRRTGLDPGYISRLASGSKEDPSSYVLLQLGLKRVVIYVKAEA